MTAHDPRVTLTEVLADHWPEMVAGCDCMPVDDETGVKATLPGSWEAHVAALIEEHIAARLAPIRAILDAWDAWDGSPGPDGWMHPDSSSPRDRDRLRAALDAPVSASQDHDGAEGQGKGEKAGEGATRKWMAFPGKVPVCRDCGADWKPVQRGQCLYCGSDLGPLKPRGGQAP